MNPAAPSPSDSSIAQAFRDIAAGQFGSAKHYHEYVLGRARLIDSGEMPWHQEWSEILSRNEAARQLQAAGGDSPAAAVGGGLNGRVVDAALPPGVTESMVIAAQDAQQTFYETHSMSQYGDSHEYTMNAVACGLVAAFTPAAPVGGFVVVPMEATGDMRQAFNCQPRAIFTDAAYYAMLQAAPAAQPSAKDGVRVEETLPTWLLVLIGNYGFASANSTDVEKLHRWELLMDGIKKYRREATTAAGLVDGNEVLAALSAHVQQFDSQKDFAQNGVHASEQYVSDVLRGKVAIPEKWVAPLGYVKSWVHVGTRAALESAIGREEQEKTS